MEWGVYLPPTLKVGCFCKRGPCVETIFASGTQSMCVVVCNGLSTGDFGVEWRVNSTVKSTQYGCLRISIFEHATPLFGQDAPGLEKHIGKG